MGQNTFTWICPGGVFKIIVEGGASGAAGGATVGGGGGGEYGRETISVIPGTPYAVATGIGGPASSGANGDDSQFDGATFIVKRGLFGVFLGPGGLGGTGGTGDFLTDGGRGGPGYNGVTGPNPGNGGGGGGGDSAAGSNAVGSSGGLGGVSRGGKGGDGGGVTASPGSTPGGGGGADGFGVGSTGGDGADGFINIWDDTGNIGWPAVTAFAPIAQFGSPPPNPVPPSNPKARKTISIV